MKWMVVCFLVGVSSTLAMAQRVGIGTTNPDPSALLDVSSTSKGILIPRMSTVQRKAIVNPEESLMVYDTTSDNFWYYNQGWKSLASNQMTGDSAFIIGIQTGNIPSYTMDDLNIEDSSAYLYDTGGPNGNYGNNEDHYVHVDVPGFSLTRILIISNNIEYPYDSLFIYSGEGEFSYTGNETDTLFTVDNFFIRFKSNSVNTQPGFKIRVDVYADNIPSATQNSPLAGLYFIPEKKALMGGLNLNDRWDADSVGIYTLNYGVGNLAQGPYSTVIGTLNIATGNRSFIAGSDCIATSYNTIALGDHTKATSNNAMAMGRYTTASGFISTAMGTGTIASGTYSTAMGESSQAIGYSATAMGAGTKAIGTGSTAMGVGSIATGNYSTAMGSDTKALGLLAALATGYFSVAYASASSAFGYFTKAKSYAGMVVGIYNDSTDASGLNSLSPNTRLFQIGNGTQDYLRSNAMTVLQNGNTGIGLITPLSRLHVRDGSFLADGQTGNTPVSGPGTRMMWIPSKRAFRAGEVFGNNWNHDSIGVYSVAMGHNCIASGEASFAHGLNTRATGYASIALGTGTAASGESSIAFGGYSHARGLFSTAWGEQCEANGAIATAWGDFAQATGTISTSFGYFTKAKGNMSTATGSHTVSKSFAGTVIGTYNDSTNALNDYDIHPDNRLFQIGNGTANNLRSNAMTVLQNGNIGIGMTTPGFLLNFPSSLGNKISLWGSAGNHYGFGIQSALLQIHTDGSGSDVAFGYGSSNSFTETMRIKGNGNVGIGVITPYNALDVAGRIRLRNGLGGSAGFYLNNNDNSAELGFIGSYGNDNLIGMYGYNGAGWNILMNTFNGNTGIGVIPTEKLQVAGNGLFSGTVTASCGVLVCSDIRYKKNIQPVANALTSILAIKGIYYDWAKELFPEKSFSDERQLGFSAQELEQIIPEVVHTDSNGYKTVDYSRLTPVLVEAIKEQQKQIDELKEKIEWLMKNN